MLRVGLAGVGGLGQMHLRNYLAFPDVEVVALADLDPDRREGKLSGVDLNLGQAEASAAVGPVRSYADYRDLCVAGETDVISVCLPSDLHCDATVRALDAGKHVFCEKPIALTVADGQRMLDAAAASGKTLMVGHCLRFWPEYVAVADAVRSGRYGRVLSASFTRNSGWPHWGCPDGWFAAPGRSGGPAIDMHIHDADFCVWLWGEPEAISADGAYIGGVPSVLQSRWRYAGGLVAQFETAWEAAASAPFFFGFKVTLERATFLYDSRNDKGLQLATEADLETLRVAQASAYELEDRAFVDGVASGRAIDVCPPTESLLSLQCVTEEAQQVARACGRPWHLS